MPSLTRSTSPIYKSHPLYSFRRLIIISALVGVTLHVISATSGDVYAFAVWIWGGFALIVSGFLALADLFIWAHREHEEIVTQLERNRDICTICAEQIRSGECPNSVTGAAAVASSQDTSVNFIARNNDADRNGNDKPKWPVRWIMVSDFLLTGALCWMLVYEMFATNDAQYHSYYPEGNLLINSWAIVPVGFSFVLHARCWWRQFRAREKAAWIRRLMLSIEGGRQSGDIEAGVEQTAHHHGHQSASGHEGNGMHGSERADPRSPPVQTGNGVTASIREIVNGLNRETIQALKSKSWLPDTSNRGERQPLLKHGGSVRAEEVVSGKNGKCFCSPPRTCHFVKSRSDPARAHESADHMGNDHVGDNPGDTQEVEQIAIDRTVTCLTPSHSGVTSTTSSTVSSSNWSQDNNGVGESRKDIGGETDIEDEGAAANSTVLSHRGRPHHIVDNEGDGGYDNDMDIMVVKKAKKGKSKVQKEMKGKSKEIMFDS